MDKNKRWKRVTALFLIFIAVFGVAEDSKNSVLTFNEVQEQTTVADVQAEINSQETADQETESENTFDQEAESEDASEQETESEDASDQETETENIVINYEELQCIRRSDKYGYVDEIGRTVIPFEYDDAGSYVEGLAYFRIGEEYGFMDETQTPVFYLDCDSVSNFQDGFAYISIDGRYGYIDRSGEIVIEPVYHDVDNFQDGYAVIMKNGKFGVIDQTGKEVVEPKYKNIDRGGENFVVQEEEKYQIVNRDGQNLLKSLCEEIFNYNYSVVGFRDRKQGICGYVEGENVVYFEEDYDWMFFVPQRELVILKKGEIFGIKDFQGNTVIPFEYQHISYNPYYDTYHIVDQKGNESEIDADDFTGKKDGIVLEEIYPNSGYNKLTPRVSKYLDFLKHGKFVVNDIMGNGQDKEVYAAAYDEEVTTRLYDFGELGSPALYFYGHGDFRVMCSGFFAIRGEEVVCLVSAYNGGGSGGGERVRLWYDREEDKLLPGRTSHRGGGVFGAGGEVYDLIDGECQKKISWEDREYAGPEGGEMTISYYVNEERATEEYYNEVDRRYSMIAIP